ncbi:MAG: AtpZ/AtpI family protein [Chloroflexi bacterium]|nr:AtpZ/AtpI family protein [Chloroflexota bacterium]
MNARKMAVVLQLLGIGWYVAICIGGGAFGGLLIDRQLNSSPAFTLAGLGLGIVIAMIGMIRMLFAVLSSGSDSQTQRKR